MIQKLKYPIGKPEIPKKIERNHIENWVITINEFPFELEKLIKDLFDN